MALYPSFVVTSVPATKQLHGAFLSSFGFQNTDRTTTVNIDNIPSDTAYNLFGLIDEDLIMEYFNVMIVTNSSCHFAKLISTSELRKI